MLAVHLVYGQVQTKKESISQAKRNILSLPVMFID